MIVPDDSSSVINSNVVLVRFVLGLENDRRDICIGTGE